MHEERFRKVLGILCKPISEFTMSETLLDITKITQFLGTCAVMTLKDFSVLDCYDLVVFTKNRMSELKHRVEELEKENQSKKKKKKLSSTEKKMMRALLKRSRPIRSHREKNHNEEITPFDERKEITKILMEKR